jgi:hypothetical protein
VNDEICPRCRGPKKPFFALCWRCHQNDREESEYQAGFREGITEGMRRATRNPGVPKLDMQMWRRLQQLCHPDKHGNSEASKTAAQWLNSVRPE